MGTRKLSGLSPQAQTEATQSRPKNTPAASAGGNHAVRDIPSYSCTYSDLSWTVVSRRLFNFLNVRVEGLHRTGEMRRFMDNGIRDCIGTLRHPLLPDVYVASGVTRLRVPI